MDPVAFIFGIDGRMKCRQLAAASKGSRRVSVIILVDEIDPSGPPAVRR
jgi:hypothetical protein